MVHRVLCCILFSLVIAGCSGPRLKNSAGERLKLSGYDRIALESVEVASGINHPDVAEELAAQIRHRLSDSESWTQPADATKEHQIDLTVTVIKVTYPSRSKVIWLGSAHKMTCRLQVHDHATDDLLGTAKISRSVEPLLGNAALLNFGAIGVLGRTAFDTRKHDAASLHNDMAQEIVQALERAKEEHP